MEVPIKPFAKFQLIRYICSGEVDFLIPITELSALDSAILGIFREDALNLTQWFERRRTLKMLTDDNGL